MATPQQIAASLTGYPRTLTWNDFTARSSSPSPPFAAQTSTSFNMTHGPAALQSDGYYRLTNVRVRVSINSNLTWRDTSWFASASQADQDALLVHEQGHFELGGLVARDLCVSLLNLSLSDAVADAMRGVGNSAQARLNYARTSLSTDAARLGREATATYQWVENSEVSGVHREGQYDSDTNHGANTVAQTKWNDLFRFCQTSGTGLALALMMNGCRAGMPGACMSNTP